MSNIGSVDLSNLMTARRLLEAEMNAELRRAGKHVEEKSALDYYQEDQALISSPSSASSQSASLPPLENINVNLAELRANIHGRQSAKPVQEQAVAVTSTETIEIKMELRYTGSTPLEGLIVHDRNYAESDRYLFKFADGATFTILDKWTNKSTTVWGDPHVDVDDVNGNMNGDFKDLKASDDHTTFMLMDGTRVTFTAKDSGLIQQVDIFKGEHHVKGLGADSKDFSEESGLFSTAVMDNGVFAANKTPIGDLIFAGGDGNDWFDASNKLLWGKTTGATMTQRPLAALEFYYRQTVSQSVSVQTIARQA